MLAFYDAAQWGITIYLKENPMTDEKTTTTTETTKPEPPPEPETTTTTTTTDKPEPADDNVDSDG